MTSPKAVINTRGHTCSCCFNGFDNGDIVMLMDCGGPRAAPPVKHLICRDCSDLWDGHLIGEEVAEEGGRACPSCQRRFHSLTVFHAENFYAGKGTEDEPVNIDEE